MKASETRTGDYVSYLWDDGRISVRVPSKSGPDSEHVVWTTPSFDVTSCDCKGFRFRAECSHVREISAALRLVLAEAGLYPVRGHVRRFSESKGTTK